MGIFRDNYDDLTLFSWFLICCAIIVILVVALSGLVAWSNIAYWEGRETTVTGSIQLHQLKREVSPFYAYNYTNVEMRTYSGDTHHISLFGHIDLEYGATYTIRYKYANYWMHLFLVNEIIEITRLDTIPSNVIN